jgi:hypothetical protein
MFDFESNYDSEDDSTESDSEDDFSGRVGPLTPFMGDHLNNHHVAVAPRDPSWGNTDSPVASLLGTLADPGDGFLILTENTPLSDICSHFESDSDSDDDFAETAELLPTFLLPVETTLQSKDQSEDDSIGRVDPLLQVMGNHVDNTACGPAVGRPPRREGDRP